MIRKLFGLALVIALPVVAIAVTQADVTGIYGYLG